MHSRIYSEEHRVYVIRGALKLITSASNSGLQVMVVKVEAHILSKIR